MNETNNKSLKSLDNLVKELAIPSFDYSNVWKENHHIVEVPIQEDFIIGLIEGDRSFHLSFSHDYKIKVGFHITGSLSNEKLFMKIKDYIGLGTSTKTGKNVLRYRINRLNEISEGLLPMLEKYSFVSVKNHHFEIFKQVCNRLKNNQHKTVKGFINIVELAYDMNKKGKRRKLDKKVYITSYLNHINE